MRGLGCALLLAGCSYTLNPEGTACVTDADCAAGFACSSSHCHAAAGGVGGGGTGGGTAIDGGLLIVFEKLQGFDGTVSGGPTPCTDTCSIPAPGPIHLTASGQFAAWRGACKGTDPDCVLPNPSGATVVAVFGPRHYMFVTSATVTGTFGGLDAGDALCNASAADAGLPDGLYNAWLSDSTQNAGTRVSPGGWLRTDGRVFARSAGDLNTANGLVAYPPRFDEHGNDLGAGAIIQVFTGSDVSGNWSVTSDCAGWTSDVGAAAFGELTAGSKRWSNTGVTPCSVVGRLYCFQDVSSLPIRPPMVPHRIAFVASTTMTPSLGRPHADMLCMSANYPTRTFLAVMAISGHGALERFGLAGLPWGRPDDVLLFDSASDATGVGALLAPIERLDDSTLMTGDFAWTGAATPTSLPATQDNCNDWSDPNSLGLVARLSSTAASWSGGSQLQCNQALQIICLEQ
jgi:hypothetical protein